MPDDLEGEAGGLDPVPADDLHRAIGAVVAAMAHLEFGLSNAVTSLTHSPLTSLVVQGERASTLVAMCERLLNRGLGSSAEDEVSGRTERLGLLSHADTQSFLSVLKDIKRLNGERDHVVHSMWLPSDTGGFSGHKVTRTKHDVRVWNLERLERLRQDIANATADVFIATWNATSTQSGMERMEERHGDVS